MLVGGYRKGRQREPSKGLRRANDPRFLFQGGTHRLYDHNDNNGDGIIPQVLEVQRDSPGWVGWPGTWGGPEGAGGPEGPRFSLSGALWEDPGDWVPTVNNCT